MGKAGPVIAIGLLLLAMPLEALESVEDLNPLYAALPAKRFAAVEGWERVRTPELPLSRTIGMFTGKSADGGMAGVVAHLVTTGYGGPIGLLVAFDPAGMVLRVSILNHNETQCHVPGLASGAMLAQFIGIELVKKFRLLIGLKKESPGDIEAMSGGTVTSRAITEAITEARIAFYLVRSRGLLEKP
jgi:Na+-translocating ferredoxin:NAD+ oxidoreductase RnfG subunit